MIPLIVSRARLFIALLCLSLPAFAGGRAEFVAGEASVINSKGESRVLERGGRVEAGETVLTATGGELHLVMDDRALIAMRANSRLIVERYVADGSADDQVALRLVRGAVRSITGWIGRTAPKNYVIKTPNATIGVRGTDHEVALVDEGPNGGTYDKVNEGGTRLTNPAGSVDIAPGRAGFVAQGRPAAPRALDRVPAVFKPSANEERIEDSKRELARDRDDRMRARQAQKRAEKSGPAECGPDSPAVKAMLDFISAYENGDLAKLQGMMNPSMPGYQQFVDQLQREFATQKQIRLHIKDMQTQCGPDVANLVFTWEKRFLDLATFQPAFFSGQASVLMQRGPGGWRAGAFAGDTPFAKASGSPARMSFGPPFPLSGVQTQPSAQPITLEVSDADLAGQGSLNLQIATSNGDVETVTLSETSPGRFMRSSLMVAARPVAVGNGVIEVINGVQISARYVDQKPGNNQPPAVVVRSIVPVGLLPVETDTTPNPFSFTPMTQVAAGSQVTSLPQVITGINAPAPVSVSGGTVSIQGGPFTTSGNITNNQTLAVRVVASSIAGGSATATVIVGGVSATFTAITATAVPDIVPDPFAFLSASGVAASSMVSSNVITISGINSPSPVSVSGGEVSIGGGAFGVGGTIMNGQTLQLRGVSASTPSTTTAVTVNVGGVVAQFQITTVGAGPDTTPDPFSFTPVSNAPLSTFQTSNTVTITGIDAPTPVSIATGFVSINGGTFVTSGTILNGQTVSIRALSAATNGTTVNHTLNVGGGSGIFAITTLAADTTPDPFSFTPRAMALPSTMFTSNTVTITGINAPAPVSVSGGTYSINGGAFTSAPGSILNGQTLTLQGTSSAITDGSGVLNVIANVGGVMGTYTITTRDTTPDPFTFPPTNVLNSVCLTGGPASSATVTITGLETLSPVTISAPGSYSIAGGGFVTSGGSIGNGQTLQLRRALPGPSNSTTVTVNIGQNGPNPGTNASWTITCM
ncbi:MAG: FecR domain-containing protein [Betaproteobacteria bacterium]|nr:FecR domain-containing protein [Betaproteobacteria bacterium]